MEVSGSGETLNPQSCTPCVILSMQGVSECALGVQSFGVGELLRPLAGDVDHLHPESTAVGDGPSRSHCLCGLSGVWGVEGSRGLED